MPSSKFKIIFMGTPEFAVPSLKILINNNYTIIGVVTGPDKPAGRGQKITESPVKKYAKENKLNILQPVNLKDNIFTSELHNLKPDLQVVVAFRMLPEIVWKFPALGTINLHASLLPQYRGAAPVNWAIINGEKETGLTTFFLNHEIDTGNIISQEKILIAEEETAGTLHDKLMNAGAELVLKAVRQIENGNCKAIPQNYTVPLKKAPKIFKDDCRINWNKTPDEIFNFIRGLSPYPGAWTLLNTNESNSPKVLKIFKVTKEKATHHEPTHKILTDNKNYLKISIPEAFINLLEVQIEGKNRMNIKDFLKGFRISGNMYIA